MHQQPRAPPRVTSPASAPQTAMSRTNSTRDAARGGRSRAGSALSSRDTLGSPTIEKGPILGPPADSVKKLDQIIQNFYSKVASVVLDSRMKLKYKRDPNGLPKLSKWFQLETAEIDDFREELKIWKTCGSFENIPPAMIIEIYLDTSKLKDNQSLVTVDENGKRWDVMEQLNAFESSSSAGSSPSRKGSEVIIERWRVELKRGGTVPTDDFGPILPTIYKKAIVFFRSLFAAARLLPSWKFASQGPAKNSHPALTPRCRITMSEPSRQGPDRLKTPIDGRSDPTNEYLFGDLEVPVGRLSTTVTYRNDCAFRIDDSESLLSSRFMVVDENLFRPSISSRNQLSREPIMEVGSLRDHQPRPAVNNLQQTYGSLSTFHGQNPLGTSPISALRAVRPPGSDTSSPPGSYPLNNDIEVPNSLPISRTSAQRPPLRVNNESSSRRQSISFQPFKAGSLSGSPITRHIEPESPASPHSLTRPPAVPSLSQPRTRTSLTAGMPASLRGGPHPTNEPAMTSSPRPASTSRYSSSFTHRRGRPSFGGASRAGDDEQGSSGRQSLASSVAQPGSGLLAEVGGTSSGSLYNEDDNISEFLKALDSKKTLKSFETSGRGDSATNRTVAQLSKFHLMRESNNALTDSMTSSMQMNRSSSSSSRQMTSVPSMAGPAGASASMESSPGKPMSPHTQHTPAVPSRLSENSIIDYSRPTSRQPDDAPSGPSREDTITQDGTTAIDIPLSPRLTSYQRRASSVAQKNRASAEDDEAELAFAHRSVSLGAEERLRPAVSALRGKQIRSEGAGSAGEAGPSGLQPAAEIQTAAESTDMMQHGSAEDNPPEGLIPIAPSSSPFGRRRYVGMGVGNVSRGTPPQSSRGSFTGSISRLVRGDDESVGEEPLVFDFSEMDAQGRRSMEEGRGGTQRRGWLS